MYRLLYEHASDAICSVDLERGVIESVNRRLLELTGHTASELVGQSISVLCATATDEGRGCATLDAQVLENPGLHDEVRVRRSDDYSVYTAVAVRHFENAGRRFAIAVVRDTTERRMLERELFTKHLALRQAHEELLTTTRALEERNRELTSLGTRAATLAKRAAIGEFTAGVAHSINNPLAALMSTTRQLQKLVDSLGLDDERARRAATLLRRQLEAADRIGNVVTAMRRVHKGGASRCEAEPVVLANELEGALAIFAHRLAGIEVVRDYHEAPRLEAYPDELQHLFCNLIDNALLAMGPRGRLELGVDTHDGEVRVLVADDGPGVPREVAERLFEPFVSTREGGTGLGLSMAQRAAHRHGGRIYFEPREPRGSRFVVELPSESVRGLNKEGAGVSHGQSSNHRARA